MKWNDKQPIYQQLKDLIRESILEGAFPEETLIPSIRQVSADYHINPLTVSKAYAALVEDGVIEKKRGLGMFVKPGAKEYLLTKERARFIEQEWPLIMAKIKRLNINLEEIIK